MGLRIVILGRTTEELRREIAGLCGGAEVHDLGDGPGPSGAIRALDPDLAVIGRPASMPVLLEEDAAESLRTRIEHEYQRSTRYRHPLGVLLLSLDGAEELERTHGRTAVDALFESLGDAARRALREVDLLYRPSRTEIIVMVPETGPSGAIIVAERLRAVAGRLLFKPVRAASDRPALPLRSTASVGIANCPGRGIATGSDLIVAAREAMEGARAAGGDQVALAT